MNDSCAFVYSHLLFCTQPYDRQAILPPEGYPPKTSIVPHLVNLISLNFRSGAFGYKPGPRPCRDNKTSLKQYAEYITNIPFCQI